MIPYAKLNSSFHKNKSKNKENHDKILGCKVMCEFSMIFQFNTDVRKECYKKCDLNTMSKAKPAKIFTTNDS
jgi:hypothetical protein